MSDSTSLTTPPTNEDTYNSWIPRGCRRVLETGLYGCMALYAMAFVYALINVLWTDHRSLAVGMLVVGGIPGLIILLMMGWYRLSAATRQHPREHRDRPSTSLASRFQQIANCQIFVLIGLLILAFGVGTAQAVWAANLTAFTLLCAPVCGIVLAGVLLVIGWYGWLYLQAALMNRYAHVAVNAAQGDYAQVFNVYQQRRDTPQKFIMLAQLSHAQGDQTATEIYLRQGLAHVKKCHLCFLYPTINVQWFSAGLHDELTGLLLQQGRFAEAGDAMREHLSTYVSPNAGAVICAWCYFLANDKDNARAMLDRVQPITFLRSRNLLIIQLTRENNQMSQLTAIGPALQCLIPFLHVNLYGQFDPAVFEIRASQREVWEEVAALDTAYGKYVRALLPTMYTVWDLYGIGPTPAAEVVPGEAEVHT